MATITSSAFMWGGKESKHESRLRLYFRLERGPQSRTQSENHKRLTARVRVGFEIRSRRLPMTCALEKMGVG